MVILFAPSSWIQPPLSALLLEADLLGLLYPSSLADHPWFPHRRPQEWPQTDCGPQSCLSGQSWHVSQEHRGQCPPLGTRIEPRCVALQVDYLPSKIKGKPKNTGVGSLSLLLGIFLTEELHQCLLNCWQMLDQLSYQESPWEPVWRSI